MLPLLIRSDSLHHLGLFLIVGLLLFSPLLDGGTTHVAVMIIRLLIISSLGIYFYKAMMTKALQLRRIAVGAPVLLFLGLVVGSTIYSPYTNQSAQWLMVCLCYAVLLYVVVVFVERWEDAARLRFVLIGMALAQATLVFGQVIVLGIGRPTGTFYNPNFLASYLATAAILLLAIICYAKNGLWRRRSWTSWPALSRHVLLFGGLSILLLAIFLTGSRGGGLALIAGTTVVIWSRYGKRGLLGLSVFVIIAVLVPNPIRDRVMTEHIYNPAAYARWQMWESAVHLFHGNDLALDPSTIMWPRALGISDRALRELRLGGEKGDRLSRFVITEASEVMAILALATDHHDLQRLLGRILVGLKKSSDPVVAQELGCVGSMAVLLRDALMPNLVQTLEGTPAFVHTGPFGNIAHGNCSVVSDAIALRCADIVVTEAGFGSDLGAEKFFNIKWGVSGFKPDPAVVAALPFAPVIQTWMTAVP